MPALADTTLVIANPAQRRSIYHNMWQNWEKPRGATLEQAVAYFERVNEMEPSSNGRAVYWALVDRADSEGAEILASTKTLRRDAKTSKDGTVSDVVSYVITSVVVAPHHRKNGYATHMLALLHYAISLPATLPAFPTAWGAPPHDAFRPRDATFATLWSDVGPDFYRNVRVGRGSESREGWVVQWDEQVTWDVDPSAGEREGLPQGWTAVEQVTDIPASLLAQWSDRYLDTAAKTLPEGTTLAYDAPTSPGITHWITRFTRFYPPHLSARGHIHHAYLHSADGRGPADPASLIILVPVYDPTDPAPTLIVSFLGLTHRGLAPSAYDLVTRQAARYGCTRVEVWQVAREIVESWQEEVSSSGGKVESVKRKEHLGAMVWYGQEPVERVRAVGGE